MLILVCNLLLIMANSQNSHSLSSKPLHNEDDSFSSAMLICNSTAISMAMQTVVELGLFDIIHKAGPDARLSAAEIASKLPSKNPGAATWVDRLLRLLADYSVLHCAIDSDGNQETGDVRRLYGLTPVAKFFLPDVHGASLGPYIKMAQHERHINCWSHMKDSILEGGDSPFKRCNGSDFYDYTNLDLSFGAVFNEGSVNYATILMNKILETYKGFEELNSLVDVGGGLGISLNMITSKYPHIQGINFDLPTVIQEAPSYPGVKHVGGDMFESVPKGDAVFMRWILQDWSDERCVKLLKNCYDATPKNGKLILVHAVLGTEPDTSATTKINNQFEIFLRTYTGGRERTKQEYMNLIKSAGFSGIRFECLVYAVWVMEIFK